MTEQATLDEGAIRAQVAAQAHVVAALARNLAGVHEAHAEILEAGPCSLVTMWGVRSAALMEKLGDILNGMDAVSEEDAWMQPVFQAAQTLFPTTSGDA